jgi:hypothetical protein
MTDNGPELWSKILAQMPAGAVVAGGAVRDYLLGVPPKDIDVFMGTPAEIQDPPTQDRYFTEAFDARSGLYRIDSVWERQEEYAALTHIDLVSSGTLFGWKVDAVVLTNFTTGDALIEDFDFGITRSWFSPERGLVESQLAFDDMTNRHVTLLLGDRRERAEKRFARFNERMRGTFTFVDGTT